MIYRVDIQRRPNGFKTYLTADDGQTITEIGALKLHPTLPEGANVRAWLATKGFEVWPGRPSRWVGSTLRAIVRPIA